MNVLVSFPSLISRCQDDNEKVPTIETYLGSIKDGSNLGGSERKTHVTGMSGGDGVHGNTTSLVGGGGKGGLGLGINGSAHHKRGVLQRRE
jgi:hypothetical protein